MRIRYDADVSILNMGFLRSDTIHPAGPITIKTFHKMVPVLDGICLLEVSGEELLKALEIGVSKWPSYDGRFPSVSGIRLTFDGSKPPLQRITKIEKEGGFDLKKKYKLSVKAFLAAGNELFEY
jgi:5'-nucleotidase